jgi:hypothetical protein
MALSVTKPRCAKGATLDGSLKAVPGNPDTLLHAPLGCQYAARHEIGKEIANRPAYDDRQRDEDPENPILSLWNELEDDAEQQADPDESQEEHQPAQGTAQRDVCPDQAPRALDDEEHESNSEEAEEEDQ